LNRDIVPHKIEVGSRDILYQHRHSRTYPIDVKPLTTSSFLMMPGAEQFHFHAHANESFYKIMIIRTFSKCSKESKTMSHASHTSADELTK